MAEAKSSDRLDKMEQRLDDLETVIWKGNGKESLVTQIARMQTWGIAFLTAFTVLNLAIELISRFAK